MVVQVRLGITWTQVRWAVSLKQLQRDSVQTYQPTGSNPPVQVNSFLYAMFPYQSNVIDRVPLSVIHNQSGVCLWDLIIPRLSYYYIWLTCSAVSNICAAVCNSHLHTMQGEQVDLCVSHQGMRNYLSQLLTLLNRYQARVDWLQKGQFRFEDLLSCCDVIMLYLSRWTQILWCSSWEQSDFHPRCF